MKKFKIIFAVSAFLFTIPFSACGAAIEPKPQLPSEKSTVIISSNEIHGIRGMSLEEIFAEQQIENSENFPVLSDLILTYTDNHLLFDGSLSYDGQAARLNTSGPLYKNEKTKNSGKAEDLVLADIDDVETVHFVQVRFDKEKLTLSIILQSIDTKELFYFTTPFNADQFSTIYDLVKNPVTEEALERKIIELFSVSRNLLNFEQDL